jgi:hypothetical protein
MKYRQVILLRAASVEQAAVDADPPRPHIAAKQRKESRVPELLFLQAAPDATGLRAAVTPWLVAGFFAACTVAALILLHILGSRLFFRLLEKGRGGPIALGAASLILGLAGVAGGIFITLRETALFVGLASGFLIWTAFGEVAEQLGWVSPLSRSAVILFLLSFAMWLSGFLVRGIPVAVMAGAGYPACIWGLHLARARILAKWGPSSLAAIALALANSAVGGGGLALGMSGGTPVSGMVGGVIFAMSTWSTFEIIWERGMARKPWRSG